MKYFVALICLVLLSCNTVNKPKRPKNLISKDKMVEIIIDMTLLSSAKGINKYEIEAHGIAPESYIYRKHNIDSLQFVLSNEYYAFDVDEYESIYDKVSDSLSVLKAHYKKLEDEETIAKRKQDSIRRAKRLDSTKLNKKIDTIKQLKTQLPKPLLKKSDSLG